MPNTAREVDGVRLYLSTWEYNAARIVTELAKIVKEHGGRVKPTRPAIISNRQLTSTIRDLEHDIEQLNKATREHGASDRRTEAVKNLERQLEDYKSIKNEPITVTHTSYINFVLDDAYYYYQMSTNPFIDFHYLKAQIKDGQRSMDASLEEDPKEWLFDCLFDWLLKSNCGQQDIIEAANLNFNLLSNAPMETVYKPERLGKIDF